MTELKNESYLDNEILELFAASISEYNSVEAGVMRFDDEIHKALNPDELFCYFKPSSKLGSQSVSVIIRTKVIDAVVRVIELVGIFSGDVTNSDGSFSVIKSPKLHQLASTLASDGIFDKFHSLNA